MSDSRSSVEIVVDEVVLRGVPPEEAQTVAAALEAELGVLAAESARAGRPLTGRAEAFRRLSAIQAPAEAPSALGEAVAGAVWGAVAGGER